MITNPNCLIAAHQTPAQKGLSDCKVYEVRVRGHSTCQSRLRKWLVVTAGRSRIMKSSWPMSQDSRLIKLYCLARSRLSER